MFSKDFLQSLQQYDLLLLGFSGGVDSTVLLHALRQATPFHGKLVAMHVHHGLSANADTWQAHCHNICCDLGVDFVAEKVDPKASVHYQQQGLEGAARALRRETFLNYLSQHKGQRCALVLAHHQEDQAETMLLQLFRGAGLKGLSAMSEFGDLDDFDLLRPLLSLSKADLLAYAEQHGLSWMEDESNTDLSFDRNFLRHQILPQLRERWPQVSACTARSAKHCGEAQHLLDQHYAAILASACPRPDQILLRAIVGLDASEQRWLLRAWLQHLSVTMPPEVKLDRILSEVMTAAPDKMPCVHWGEHSVRRYRDCLYYVPYHTVSTSFHVCWDGQAALAFGEGMLCGAKLPLPDTQGFHLSVRVKSGGERLRLHASGPSRSLKTLMQEWGMPPWLRQSWPLIFIGEDLVAVPGYQGGPCHVTADYQKGPLGGWLESLRFEFSIFA